MANIVVAEPLITDGWKSVLSIDQLNRISLSRNECKVTMGFKDDGTSVEHYVEMTYSYGEQTERSRGKKYGQTKSERACAILRRDDLFSVFGTGAEIVNVYATTKAEVWTLPHTRRLSSALLEAANTLAFVES